MGDIIMCIESTQLGWGNPIQNLVTLPTLLTQATNHLWAAFVTDGSGGMFDDYVCCKSRWMAFCSIAPSYVKCF